MQRNWAMRACSVQRSVQQRRGAYHFRCVAFDPNLSALRMHPTWDLQQARGMVRRCGAGAGNVSGMSKERGGRRATRCAECVPLPSHALPSHRQKSSKPNGLVFTKAASVQWDSPQDYASIATQYAVKPQRPIVILSQPVRGLVPHLLLLAVCVGPGTRKHGECSYPHQE